MSLLRRIQTRNDTSPTESVGPPDSPAPDEPVRQLWQHRADSKIFSLAITSDNRFVFAGTQHGDVLAFDRAGRLLWHARVEGGVRQIALAEQAQQLITGSILGDGRHAHVWHFNGRLLHTVETEDAVWGIDITPDASVFVAGSHDKHLYIFDANGERRSKIALGGRVFSVAIARNGEHIFAACDDNRIYAFDRDGNQQWNFETGHRPWANLRIAHDAATVLAGANDNHVYSLDFDGHERWRFDTGGYVNSLAITPDGRFCVAGGNANTVFRLDAQGNVLWEFQTEDHIYGLALTPDGRHTLIGANDHTLYLVDHAHRDHVWQHALGGRIHCAAITPDGRFFASGTDANSTTLFSNTALDDASRELARLDSDLLAQFVLQRVRDDYATALHVGLVRWFTEFERSLHNNQFDVCRMLLTEARADDGLAFSDMELRYVQSLEGAYWLFQGIAHHRTGQYEVARQCYQESLAIQQRLNFQDGVDQVLAALSTLPDSTSPTDAGDSSLRSRDFRTRRLLDDIVAQPHVLGSAEQSLVHRLDNATPAEQVQIIRLAKDKGYVTPLLRAMETDEAVVRTAASAALAMLEPATQSPIVLRMLKAEQSFIRWQALRILCARAEADSGDFKANVKDEVWPAVKALTELDGSTDNPLTRSEAARLVQLAGDAEDMPWLLARLNDPDPDVQVAVIDALGAVGDRKALPPLRAVEDHNALFARNTRAAANDAIADIEFRHPLPHVGQIALCDTNPLENSTVREQRLFMLDHDTLFAIVTIEHITSGDQVSATWQHKDDALHTTMITIDDNLPANEQIAAVQATARPPRANPFQRSPTRSARTSDRRSLFGRREDTNHSRSETPRRSRSRQRDSTRSQRRSRSRENRFRTAPHENAGPNEPRSPSARDASRRGSDRNDERSLPQFLRRRPASEANRDDTPSPRSFRERRNSTSTRRSGPREWPARFSADVADAAPARRDSPPRNDDRPRRLRNGERDIPREQHAPGESPFYRPRDERNHPDFPARTRLRKPRRPQLDDNARRVVFALPQPENGWTPGSYRLAVTINDADTKHVGFQLLDALEITGIETGLMPLQAENGFDRTTIFPASTQHIDCRVYLKDTPINTIVTGDIYGAISKTQLGKTTTSTQLEGAPYVTLTWENPGWHAGDYRIEIAVEHGNTMNADITLIAQYKLGEVALCHRVDDTNGPIGTGWPFYPHDTCFCAVDLGSPPPGITFEVRWYHKNNLQLAGKPDTYTTSAQNNQHAAFQLQPSNGDSLKPGHYSVVVDGPDIVRVERPFVVHSYSPGKHLRETARRVSTHLKPAVEHHSLARALLHATYTLLAAIALALLTMGVDVVAGTTRVDNQPLLDLGRAAHCTNMLWLLVWLALSAGYGYLHARHQQQQLNAGAKTAYILLHMVLVFFSTLIASFQAAYIAFAPSFQWPGTFWKQWGVLDIFAPGIAWLAVPAALLAVLFAREDRYRWPFHIAPLTSGLVFALIVLSGYAGALAIGLPLGLLGTVLGSTLHVAGIANDLAHSLLNAGGVLGFMAGPITTAALYYRKDLLAFWQRWQTKRQARDYDRYSLLQFMADDSAILPLDQWRIIADRALRLATLISLLTAVLTLLFDPLVKPFFDALYGLPHITSPAKTLAAEPLKPTLGLALMLAWPALVYDAYRSAHLLTPPPAVLTALRPLVRALVLLPLVGLFAVYVASRTGTSSEWSTQVNVYWLNRTALVAMGVALLWPGFTFLTHIPRTQRERLLPRLTLTSDDAVARLIILLLAVMAVLVLPLWVWSLTFLLILGGIAAGTYLANRIT